MKLILFTFSVFFFSILLANSQQKSENKKMNTALILIDIQNDYFVNGSMPLVGSEKAGSNARQILEKFRADGLRNCKNDFPIFRSEIGSLKLRRLTVQD